MLYPTTSQNINIDIQRYGYSYSSISCCSVTQSPSESISLLATVSDNAMRSVTSYQLTFTLNYIEYTNYIVFEFCSQFSLVSNQAYDCYLVLFTGNVTVNCTASSSFQLRVQL